MEFSDVINERYSVRGYLDKEVEKEKLEYVLKAATIAPTGVNAQPFKVFVIDTKKYKQELSEIYGAKWFVEAPYVLCVHMILAATDVGLGTCYIGAFKKNKAHQFLNLDENEEAVLFTPLGYGNAEPRDTPRKELDEFVVYID